MRIYKITNVNILPFTFVNKINRFTIYKCIQILYTIQQFRYPSKSV